jgi:hypothetical protein
MKRFISTIYIFALLASCLSIYSQNSKQANSGYSKLIFSEYDYYEKQRLERKEKKIKVINTYSYFDDALERKDYFDEEGYLRKSENYYTSFTTGELKIISQIDITDYNTVGQISGIYQSSDEMNGEIKSTFENLSLSKFHETDFFAGEEPVDSVELIFDESGKLTEKRYYERDFKSLHSRLVLIYDENGRLKESKFIPTKSSPSNIKYYYNDLGLLVKEESSYEFHGGDRVFGQSYKYEFYNTGKNLSGKKINVSAYVYQTSTDCIEDYIEFNTYEYDGLYTFVHNGTDTYTFYSDDNKTAIIKNFESMTYTDDTYFANIRFDKNWVYATETSGREFKARFVKLKCDINSQILKGFIGLLIDEENVYLKQGD